MRFGTFYARFCHYAVHLVETNYEFTDERTPLNCIIGLSSLLQEMGLSEKQKESISMIITSGELLCAVVNDILDFSKLESGNVLIEIRPVCLQDILDSVVNSIEHKAKSNRITSETLYSRRLPERIETDGNRLQQILYNLLGNALKFSDTGGSVELFVDYVPREPPRDDESISTKADKASRCPFKAEKESACPFGFDKPMASSQWSQITSESFIESGILRFSVKDYGRGIDTSDFDKIFEPFGQANRDTEKLYGGTGLGLAITSRLVERLGGRIMVESEIGKWSKFTVHVPVTAVAQFDVASSLADACILYVDHPDEANRRVVSSRGVPFEHFVSCQDMYDWFMGESKSDRLLHRFLVCLIQEDLCSVDVLRKISQTLHLALITFGPTHDRIPESHLHVRSLSCRIRSVLLKAIADIRSEIDDPTRHGGRSATLLAPVDILKEVEVLIAEDNVINQKVLCRMLQRSGVERIDVADNGQEAVERCASKHYDVIFMDMQMPIMCGDEACRIILESYKGRPRRPKIAFVSAHVSNTFEAQAFDAGADGFLSKPFNVKMFEEFIRSLDLCPLAGPCGT
jgi:CheY-like chemotaxis protein